MDASRGEFLIAHNRKFVEQYLCKKELLCITECATGGVGREAWASAVSARSKLPQA
jgi:hypothetical protein